MRKAAFLIFAILCFVFDLVTGLLLLALAFTQ